VRVAQQLAPREPSGACVAPVDVPPGLQTNRDGGRRHCRSAGSYRRRGLADSCEDVRSQRLITGASAVTMRAEAGTSCRHIRDGSLTFMAYFHLRPAPQFHRVHRERGIRIGTIKSNPGEGSELGKIRQYVAGPGEGHRRRRSLGISITSSNDELPFTMASRCPSHSWCNQGQRRVVARVEPSSSSRWPSNRRNRLKCTQRLMFWRRYHPTCRRTSRCSRRREH